MTLEETCDVAEQIKLNPCQTYIEPSRHIGYLTKDRKAATALRLFFSAKRWPTKADDVYLMYLEPSLEVSAWMKSTSYVFEPVEIVAVLFASDEDQESFENVIWPARRKRSKQKLKQR